MERFGLAPGTLPPGLAPIRSAAGYIVAEMGRKRQARIRYAQQEELVGTAADLARASNAGLDDLDAIAGDPWMLQTLRLFVCAEVGTSRRRPPAEITLCVDGPSGGPVVHLSGPRSDSPLVRLTCPSCHRALAFAWTDDNRWRTWGIDAVWTGMQAMGGWSSAEFDWLRWLDSDGISLAVSCSRCGARPQVSGGSLRERIRMAVEAGKRELALP